MSLYNLIHGTDPLAPIVLNALGLEPLNIPRFRDAFVRDNPESGGRELAIHTRTGGGNRSYYESEQICRKNYPRDFDKEDETERPRGPWNADLRGVAGFLRDEDAKNDDTYATFYFRVPDAFVGIIETLMALRSGGPEPAEKWQTVMDDLQSGADTPESRRALEVGKEISGLIRAAFP